MATYTEIDIQDERGNDHLVMIDRNTNSTEIKLIITHEDQSITLVMNEGEAEWIGRQLVNAAKNNHSVAW